MSPNTEFMATYRDPTKLGFRVGNKSFSFAARPKVLRKTEEQADGLGLGFRALGFTVFGSFWVLRV